MSLAPEDITVPLSAPSLRGNEWAYVKECLDTEWVSSGGAFVRRFEGAVAAYVNRAYGVATVNGTAALHTALLVAGVQPGEEVLVSDLTFIAPVNAVRYVGASPVLIGAEPEFWQMDPEKVAQFLTKGCEHRKDGIYNRHSGRRVSCILPVHILGHPCDMDALLEMACRYDLIVIEDATESLGADYRGRRVGSLGDVACFSFNGNKIITTGGGGMLVTDDPAMGERARYLTTQAKDDPQEYVHGEIGYNYRLTNVQAALGVAQMEALQELVESKRSIAEHYSRAFAQVPGVEPMRQASWATSSWWLYTVLVDAQVRGEDSRALMRRLAKVGIMSRPLWQPMHLSPAHRDVESYYCEVSAHLYERALSLPSSANLTLEDQRRVIDTVASPVFEVG